MFHRFLGGVRLRFKMIQQLPEFQRNRIKCQQSLKKKEFHQRFYLSFFTYAPFISKKKKKKEKKNAEKDQPLTGRYLDNIEAVR